MTASPGADACPCGRRDAKGRPRAFAACCEPFLAGTAVAPDAEALMRSRYTAYARGADAYLHATWHPSTRPAGLETDPALKWLGLDVHEVRRVDDEHAEVRFTARYRSSGGRGSRLQERSRFVREDGRWYYVDGDVA